MTNLHDGRLHERSHHHRRRDGDYTARDSRPARTFIPDEAGTYNWIAVYSGDPPNTSGRRRSAATRMSRASSARQPGITTQVNDDELPLGSTLDDTATLTGTALDPDGSEADGTITFTAYGPHSDADTCETEAYTSVVTITDGGDGDYMASSGTGGDFIPTEPGMQLDRRLQRRPADTARREHGVRR